MASFPRREKPTKILATENINKELERGNGERFRVEDDAIRFCRREIRVLQWEEETGKMKRPNVLFFALCVF